MNLTFDEDRIQLRLYNIIEVYCRKNLYTGALNGIERFRDIYTNENFQTQYR